MSKNIQKYSSILADARKKNKLIKPIPLKIFSSLKTAELIKSSAETKLGWTPIGFKIGATNKKIMKLLKAKKPFYSYLFKEKSFPSGSKIYLNHKVMGIELELLFKMSKKIFDTNITNKKQLYKYIKGVAPTIELVGLRQKLKKITNVKQAIIDFGLNILFIRTNKFERYKNFDLNFKTNVKNLVNDKIYYGHTKNILGNPINALYWLIKELKKKKVSLKRDFLVSSGSTTPIIPIKKGDKFYGEILNLGKIKVNF